MFSKNYKQNNYILGSGAFCKVYECEKINNKSDNNAKNNTYSYIVKVLKNKNKYELLREINIYNKLQKHKLEHLEYISVDSKTSKKFNISKNVGNISHITHMYDYFIEKDETYIVFEKMNLDLYKFVEYFKDDAVPDEIIKHIVLSICFGIKELNNSNIIHADIKPDNVMIQFSNKNLKSMDQFMKKKSTSSINVKLIDLNKSIFINELLKPITVQTLNYQAPEITLGNSDYNEKIDIWSIGAILYFLITKREFINPYNKTHESRVYSNSKSDESNDSGGYSSNSTNSFYTSANSSNCSNNSYYDNNILEDYIYLSRLESYIGPIDKQHLKGENIDVFYKNYKLIGPTPENVEFFENDTDFKIKCVDILKSIFVYNIEERININDLIYKIANL